MEDKSKNEGGAGGANCAKIYKKHHRYEMLSTAALFDTNFMQLYFLKNS